MKDFKYQSEVKSSFSVWNSINEPAGQGEWVECTEEWLHWVQTSEPGTRSLVAASSSATRHAGAGSGGAGREREEPPTSRNLPVFIEQGMFCHQLGWAPRAGRSWRESESERSRGILIWTNTITHNYTDKMTLVSNNINWSVAIKQQNVVCCSKKYIYLNPWLILDYLWFHLGFLECLNTKPDGWSSRRLHIYQIYFNKLWQTAGWVTT